MNENELFVFEEDPDNEEITQDTTRKTKSNAKSKPIKKEKKKEVLVHQTFIISEDMQKAIKIKAIAEGKQLNVMLRELLSKVVEPKYFDKID